MTAYEELKSFAANLAADSSVHAFFDYVLDKTTSVQYREILNITNCEDVLHYLACAYGCYALSHNWGHHSLIVNPEKIFRTEQEQKDFIALFLKFARDELAQAQAVNAQRKATPNT